MYWRGENLGAGNPESFKVILTKAGEWINRVMEQDGGTGLSRGEALVCLKFPSSFLFCLGPF